MLVLVRIESNTIATTITIAAAAIITSIANTTITITTNEARNNFLVLN
jgi:hypothetical protein